MRSRWINIIVLLALLLGAFPLPAVKAASVEEPAAVEASAPVEETPYGPYLQDYPPGTVESALLDKLAEKGSTDFVVVMAEQADLSAAYQIEDWSERGWYVYNTLRAVASRTQASVVGYALQRNIEYKTSFSLNTISITGGDLKMAEDIAKLPGVALVRESKVAYINPEDMEPADPTAPDAYGWNLDELDPNNNLFGMQASQVWEQFGVTGEGIVVANIDTGVTYQHEALIRQYRGNNGDGSFDNDFSWYAPTSDAEVQCGGDAAVSPCDSDSHGSGTAGIMVGETEDQVVAAEDNTKTGQ